MSWSSEATVTMVHTAAQSKPADAADETTPRTYNEAAATPYSPTLLSPSSSNPSSPTLPAPHDLSSASATTADVPIDLLCLVRLFRHFLYSYPAPRLSRRSIKTGLIQQTCLDLFNRDYHCGTLDNSRDEYCDTYPPTIIVCEAHKPSPPLSSSDFNSASSTASSPLPLSRVNDTSSLAALFKLSRFNRVRGRFVCPVLLVDGINISRSSTLSVPAEALYNNVATRAKELYGTLYETMSASFTFRSPSPPLPSSTASGQRHGARGSGSVVEEVGGMSAREADEELLRRLSTRYIVDLMVEHKKKWKMGVPITSSEKSESQQQHQQQALQHNHSPSHGSRPLTVTTSLSFALNSASPPPSSPPPYADFTITPIPYPGCEFFAMYHNHGHNAVGLVFDWSQSFVDSLLSLEGGGVELEGLELSHEGEDEDGIYEYDTHWACWMHQKQDKQSQQHSQARESQNSSAASQPSTAASASSSQRTGGTRSLASPVTDSLDGEEDPIEAAGRVRQPSAARDEPTAPTWRNYKDWSVITLTKNYLLLLLHIIASNSAHTATDTPPAPSGLSLHCISGWDRTPLFISLLRLSLWGGRSGTRFTDSGRDVVPDAGVRLDAFLTSAGRPPPEERGHHVCVLRHAAVHHS